MIQQLVKKYTEPNQGEFDEHLSRIEALADFYVIKQNDEQGKLRSYYKGIVHSLQYAKRLMLINKKLTRDLKEVDSEIRTGSES